MSDVERIRSMSKRGVSNIFGGNSDKYIKGRNSSTINKMLDVILKKSTGGCGSCGGSSSSKNISGGDEQEQSLVVDSNYRQITKDIKRGRPDNVKVSFGDVSKIIEKYLENIKSN